LQRKLVFLRCPQWAASVTVLFRTSSSQPAQGPCHTGGPDTLCHGISPPAEIDNTIARCFPLVHQLIHFADLRNVYREMREALICAKRRAFAIPTCSPSVASTSRASPWLA